MDSKFTLVPNVLFDSYLSELTLAEIKILLVVIRQTRGWKKEWDWIASKQLQTKTGCSRRSISAAIDSLVQWGFLDVTDDSGSPVDKAWKRQGKQRLFYRYNPKHAQIMQRICAKMAQELAQNLRITK